MDREEMLRRLKEGEDPLEIEILRWQDTVNGVGDGHSSLESALCETYGGNIETNTEETCCHDCPIKLHTGKSRCDGTPYDEYDATLNNALQEALKPFLNNPKVKDPYKIWDDALNKARSKRTIKPLAFKELEFLKSLRKRELVGI